LEIKYLAIVESALNPKAVSRVGATGLWQFMYQTGKQYNLKIDSYVDERSDPLKSSEAAAQYMATMYGIFGDWDLVLASYNSGPGNVAKAIRRSGGQQNYWNIRKNLPKETQGYVPAFLATMYIYEYHKEHGIKPERALVQSFATDTILIKKQMSFKQIADLLDVSVSQLQLLNPSYKMNVIPYYGDRDHFLRLPKDKIAVFASNEDKIYAYVQRDLDFREKPFQVTKAIVLNDSLNSTQRISLPKAKYYTVKSGDYLGKIASQNGVSVEQIKKWNSLNSNNVNIGQKLIVGYTKEEPKTTDNKTTSSSQTITTHTVKAGESLYTISKKYGLTIAELKELNGLKSDELKIGQQLSVKKAQQNIEKNSTENSTNKYSGKTYTVKSGDSLWSITQKFDGLTVDELKKLNNLKTNEVQVGQILKLG